jgi:hypothetical protein
MKKLVVLTVHGIGTYYEDYEDEALRYDRKLRDGLKSRLGARFDEIAWKAVLWSSDELEKRQKDLLAQRDPPRIWRSLFRFVSANLCDATAYKLPELDEDYKDSAYFKIQSMVRADLAQVEKEVPPGTPVLVLAESMGCRVISSYAWDAARDPRRILGTDGGEDGLTPFQRLETVAGLIFTGCNMPLLAMDVPADAMMPMKLPKHPLPDKPSFASAWLNFYDRDDVLGYPIQPDFSAYFEDRHRHKARFKAWNRNPNAERGPHDTVVRVKHILGWTPYAHVQYWKSGAVLDATAAEIGRLLDA